MAHADDGLRPGDACRHWDADVHRSDGWLVWLCAACMLCWRSIPEAGRRAEVSSWFARLLP